MHGKTLFDSDTMTKNTIHKIGSLKDETTVISSFNKPVLHFFLLKSDAIAVGKHTMSH